MQKAVLGLGLVFGMAVLSKDARAEDAVLHHAHSGALLLYSEAEAVILYNSFLAKEFDPDLAKTVLKELERSLNDAKKSIDRTRLVVGDQKLEQEFAKLLDIMKRAETQLRDLSTDVEEQTGQKESEPSDHKDELDGEEKTTTHDWALLKNEASWLHQDIKDARAFHQMLGKKVKGTPMKPPPKPSGKRGKKE